MSQAILLVAHGTVDDLDDLPAFLANIRRGHPAPPELVAELRRRYAAIGGSPLNAINAALATKLEAHVGLPVRLANRLWKPYPADVLRALASEGVTRVVAVPLAQHSAHVYAEPVAKAAREVGVELCCAGDWGQNVRLTEAYAARIRAKLGGGDPHVLLTAHSLPRSVVDAGDPYEREVRTSAESIARAAGAERWSLEFQSQGFGGGAWLGRGIRAALEELAALGERAVVLAPVGFLADHVEILYDVDVEAKAWAAELGMAFARTESLDAADDVVQVLADVASPLLR